MSRRKKLINNTGIPQYKIEAIARCLLPDIQAFYESEEGRREFAEWKARQEVAPDTEDKQDPAGARCRMKKLQRAPSRGKLD